MDAEGRRQTTRLWRVWTTTAQMLADRGYEITDEELAYSLDDFRARCADANGYPNKDSMTIVANPSPDMVTKYTALPTRAHPEPQEATIGSILVRFAADPDVRIKHVQDFGRQLHERKMYSGILIAAGTVTPMVSKGLANAPIPIEVFKEEDLLVNITKHKLVPKHILLAPAEKVALLERYRLKETQLPRILHTDPVAKFLGLRRGQVVKIIRDSETAGRYASYRWCI